MGKGSNIDGNHPPSYEDVEEQKQKDIPKIKGLEDGHNNMQDDKEGGAKVENQTIGFFGLVCILLNIRFILPLFSSSSSLLTSWMSFSFFLDYWCLQPWE